jgi:hypothetical protein
MKHATNTDRMGAREAARLGVHHGAAADIGAGLLGLVGDGHRVTQQDDLGQAARGDLGGGQQHARVGGLAVLGFGRFWRVLAVAGGFFFPGVCSRGFGRFAGWAPASARRYGMGGRRAGRGGLVRGGLFRQR